MRKRVSPLWKALWLPLCLAACSGDDDRGPGDSGGGDSGGVYDDPGDFDHSDCPGASLDGIDPAGVWHVDIAFPDFGSRPGVFRVDADGEALSGLLFGRVAEQVRLDGDDLFLRQVEDDGDGGERVRALDLCEARDDGSLRGFYAGCAGGECTIGEVAAYAVAPLDEPVASGMTLVSEWEGGEDSPWDESLTINVRRLGTVAYIAHGWDGLRIVDLADPAQPEDLGFSPVAYPDAGEFYNDVKLTEANGKVYALVASDLRGVVVIDVTDGARPTEVTTFPEPPPGSGSVNVHTLFEEGERLYVANIDLGGLEIYDIADPENPVLIGDFVDPDVGTFGGFVHDLSVDDGRVYLNYWNLGMVVVDTAENPAEPTVIGTFDSYDRRTSHSNWVTEAAGRRVAVHGDEDFGAHVRIVDVDPASDTAFEEIGSYETRPQVSVHNIFAVGERAFVTHYQDGLRILDLSDPTDPTEIAHYQTWPGAEPGYGEGFYEGAIGIDYDAERDLLLLADTHRGLLVLTLDR